MLSSVYYAAKFPFASAPVDPRTSGVTCGWRESTPGGDPEPIFED